MYPKEIFLGISNLISVYVPRYAHMQKGIVSQKELENIVSVDIILFHYK